MTSRSTLEPIGERLKAKRNGAPKAPVYRRLGVSPTTYDTWEAGLYLPGAEHVVDLADYLEADEEDLALDLYHEAVTRAKGLSLNSTLGETSQPAPQLIAA